MAVDFNNEEHRQKVIELVTKMFNEQKEMSSSLISDYGTEDTGGLSFGLIPMADDDDKNAFVGWLKERIQKNEIRNFCFVSEAWMVKGSNDDLDTNVRPSEHPDKTEILMASFATAKGEYQYHAEIVTVRGHKALLKWQFMGVAGFSGRFCNLFQKAKSVYN